MEDYALAATKNQAIDAIVSVMRRSLQARFRDSFITNLPSRICQTLGTDEGDRAASGQLFQLDLGS